MNDDVMQIAITEHGPYRVTGAVPLARRTIVANDEGDSVDWAEGPSLEAPASYRLCRCGHSSNKPFCDGTHATIGFDGTETASRRPYLEQASEQDGPSLTLTDAQPLCAFARFCDVAGQIWNLIEEAGDDASTLVKEEAAHCPSGRLVVWDRDTRTALEPTFERSIGVVADPAQGVAGPLWVRGGIPIVAADGTTYEVRNRVTLCRCGASRNKPFCDASHAQIGFNE
jgi:CDGSH-type Zn-finger protein